MNSVLRHFFLPAALLLPFFATALAAYPIDLNEVPAYVKRGFERSLVQPALKGRPATEPRFAASEGWVRVEPAVQRPIRVKDLNLPGLPRRNFPEFRSLPAEDFTIVFTFNLKPSEIAAMRNPVLFLNLLGENWEIYLNDQLADSRLYDFPTTTRLLRVPLSPQWMKPGTNHLILHVRGDPLSPETGLYYKRKHAIEEGMEAESDGAQHIFVVLTLIYVGLGLFHISFYLISHTRLHILYFGIFALLLGVYVFSKSTVAYRFIPDSTLLFRVELASIAMATPVLSRFLRSFLSDRKKAFGRLDNLIFWHGSLTALLALILPFNPLFDLLKAWEVTVPVFLVSFEVFLVHFFIKDTRQFIRRLGLSKGILRGLFGRIAGNLLIGSLFLAVAGVYDVVVSVFLKDPPLFSIYGMLIFLSGAALKIGTDIFQLLNSNQKLNHSLRISFLNLKRAHRSLAWSEKRYRKLIEETSEIILTLDYRGRVTAANSSLFRELGVKTAEVKGQEFTALLQREAPDGTYSHSFTNARIESFYETGDTLKIRIPLFASQRNSHILFDVKLEKIRSEIPEETEIFVKASPVEEDPALRFFVRETVHFELTNDLYSIEDIVRRLIADLPVFLEEYEISMIRIGLRETIVNAIEHGNLGISFTEKSAMLNAGSYQEEVRRRMTLPQHAGRRVRIRQTLTPKHVAYRITDEGDGFDHSSFLRIPNEEEAATTLHGRGILITKNAFTKVQYNRQGNSVLLVHELKGRSREETP